MLKYNAPMPRPIDITLTGWLKIKTERITAATSLRIRSAEPIFFLMVKKVFAPANVYKDGEDNNDI